MKQPDSTPQPDSQPGSNTVDKQAPASDANPVIEAYSTITCPSCDHAQCVLMPTDFCQFFYECNNCQSLLSPKSGDCCVYCSYGDIPCPPIQNSQGCCG